MTSRWSRAFSPGQRRGRDEASRQRFNDAFNRYYQRIYAFTFRRLRDETLADDATSDVFLVLWRRLEDAPTEDQLLLWLYGVARRVVGNHERTRRRAGRLFDRLASTHWVGGADDPSDATAGRSTTEATLAALQELKPDEREILLLAAWEELSLRQIASLFGCSENAVAIRLHRARKRLTEIMRKAN